MPLKVFPYLIEWCEQTMSGLDNVDVDSRIFLIINLLFVFRVISVGFEVGFFLCLGFFIQPFQLDG